MALARALAIQPRLLLLDEPLGALDRKLRESMQAKLVEVQRALGVTTIFVTHDQEEALTMSDRLAVMSGERHGIEQIGTPREIYDRPASLHVSRFVGRTNIWRERVVAAEPSGVIVTERGFRATAPRGVCPPSDVMLCLRPERISMSRAVDGGTPLANTVTGTVRATVFAGEIRLTMVETAIGEMLEVRALNTDDHECMSPGDAVTLSWSETSMRALR